MTKLLLIIGMLKYNTQKTKILFVFLLLVATITHQSQKLGLAL